MIAITFWSFLGLRLRRANELAGTEGPSPNISVTTITAIRQDQCFGFVRCIFLPGWCIILADLGPLKCGPLYFVRWNLFTRASVMSRSEFVFAAFLQIERSILSSQRQIIFVSDPWLTPHERKAWKSSKLRPLPNLSAVAFTYEAKRQHRSGNY